MLMHYLHHNIIILQMYTGGASSRWGDPKKFWGTDVANYSSFEFPGIHPDAARFVVDNLNVKGTVTLLSSRY